RGKHAGGPFDSQCLERCGEVEPMFSQSRPIHRDLCLRGAGSQVVGMPINYCVIGKTENRDIKTFIVLLVSTWRGVRVLCCSEQSAHTDELLAFLLRCAMYIVCTLYMMCIHPDGVLAITKFRCLKIALTRK